MFEKKLQKTLSAIKKILHDLDSFSVKVLPVSFGLSLITLEKSFKKCNKIWDTNLVIDKDNRNINPVYVIRHDPQ